MKRKFYLTLAVLVIAFNSYAEPENSQKVSTDIVGHWIFNKNETILSFEKSEMTKQEVQRFSSILRPKEIVITESLYSVYRPNQEPIKTAYSIVQGPDTNGCFLLQFKAPRIPLEIQKNELCVSGDRLFLPGVKGAKEVLDRKL